MYAHIANKWERNDKCQRVDHRMKEGGLNVEGECSPNYTCKSKVRGF